MESRAFGDLIDHVHQRSVVSLPTHAAMGTEVPSRENIFVMMDDKDERKTIFMHGINTSYMSMVKDLLDKRPAIMTHDGKVQFSDLPVAVCNTGPIALLIGNRINVAPPLTNVYTSMRCQDHFLLQTYEYHTYTQHFRQFAREVRVMMLHELPL